MNEPVLRQLITEINDSSNHVVMDDYDAGYLRGVLDTAKHILKQDNINKTKEEIDSILKGNSILDQIKYGNHTN